MNHYLSILSIVLLLPLHLHCASTDPAEEPEQESESPDANIADIVSVSASGQAEEYQFSVGIRSPDTGCDQYANWWEVIDTQGNLLYRRILAHSHVSEQPFVRSGGPVAIQAETEVIVRAHMHPDGYGGAIFRGSVSGGFEEATLSKDFAADLATTDPLPSSCAG